MPKPFPLLVETTAETARLYKTIGDIVADQAPEGVRSFRDLVTLPGIRHIAAASATLAFGADTPVDDLVQYALRDSGVVQLWMHHLWSTGSRTIYALRPELAAAFLDTDLPVAGSDLDDGSDRIVYLSASGIGQKVFHSSSGEHDLDGFYVSVQDETLSICAVGRAHAGSPVSDNALITFSAPLDILNFEEFLTDAGSDPITYRMMAQNRERLMGWFRLVANALLYIQNVEGGARLDPDYGIPERKLAEARKIKSAKQRETKLARFRANVRYYVLGESYRAPAGEKVGGSAGTSLTTRSRVRGHWRHQACGAGRRDRKLIWVEPFWRGPVDGPLSTATKVIRVG